MKIIIQAGGKGTRLEHLTYNRPKCLVPVHNRPMIFHLFNKYKDAEFVVIGDYKYDVLEKYRNFYLLIFQPISPKMLLTILHKL